MFDLPSGIVPDNVECGYLTVPEQHARPTGPTIRLAVAIIRSNAPNPPPDPLVMLQGGPGGSTIDTYAPLLLLGPGLPTDRDIILFDQRGTLYSEPALTCSEFLDLTIETLDQILTFEEELQLSKAAALDCRDRLVAEGVNLSAFDTVENAADIDALRVTLGYEQINLYGVSYGTNLALIAMRNHPQGIRSVILDAVVPPQVNFQLEAPRSQDRAFTVLFETCANDRRCNAAYPKLEQVFYATVEHLNANPARIRMIEPKTGTSYDALLDGDSLESGLFMMLYATEILPALPKIIYDAYNGTYDALSHILSILILDQTLSHGMYYSVECAQRAEFTLDDLALEDIRPSIAESGEHSARSMLEICDLWNVEPLDPAVNEPVVSDIPTLILSGEFDPITPPEYGDIAAQTLAQSYVYTFPNVGHGAALTGDCVNQIIVDFLDNPTVEPDASCLAALSPPNFITPDQVLTLPVLLRLSNLEGNSMVELILYGICLLILLSVLLIWPITWVLRLLHNRPSAPLPTLAHFAPWVAALNGVLLLGFMLILTILLLTNAQDLGTILLLGVPTEWSGLFALPLISAFLTIIMLISSVQAWLTRSWSTVKRSYFTLLTLAALGCVIILSAWGMVGTLFIR